jgi:tRNA G18 (ribose-2'-O)-methylase SpoU
VILGVKQVIRIESLDDPRVEDYRDLKDRELAARGAEGVGGGRFIAEGEQLVRRLLASRLETVSVLLAQRRADEMAPIVPPGVELFVAPDDVVNGIIGFKFHSGVMAVGRRPRRLALHEVMPPAILPRRRMTVVVCPDTNNTENLGSLIRISAAFGVDAMVLGERCCDPFFRQAVRVSMGSVFTLPIVQSQDIRADLLRLKQEHKFELVASILDEAAEDLKAFVRAHRTAVLFGNEAQGLRAGDVAMCDRRVTIPMRLGTDSLNVAVAAGVFLYELTR